MDLAASLASNSVLTRPTRLRAVITGMGQQREHGRKPSNKRGVKRAEFKPSDKPGEHIQTNSGTDLRNNTTGQLTNAASTNSQINAEPDPVTNRGTNSVFTLPAIQAVTQRMTQVASSARTRNLTKTNDTPREQKGTRAR